jgi:hypothetical protein
MTSPPAARHGVPPVADPRRRERLVGFDPSMHLLINHKLEIRAP